MQILSQVWAMEEVRAVTYIATEVILLIAIDEALDGNDIHPEMKIAVEILENALEDIEIICEEAGINSESISIWIKEALYQAKNPEKGKNGGKDKEKTGDKEKPRSKNPPARRKRYSSRKEAYEAAKRAGKGTKT